MLARGAIVATLALRLAFAGGAFSHGQKRKDADTESMRPNPAAASVDASGFAACPAGSPLGEMSLTVESSSGDRPLPFTNIIHLTEGDVVKYSPIERGRGRREGEVALVLVPSKISGKEQLLVTDPRSAEKAQQWTIPRSMSLAVFVYGPQGLSRKRVKSFLSKDDSLVAQLAEYADKTAQTEALIAALSNNESSSASMNAALTGFASQYGVSVQLDKNAPPAAQAQALFTAMNPQLSSYSPLASNSAARATQTASLATAAAGLFFGSPVGLLAGGTSMLLDLRSIAFPDTQFRSSFAQSLKNKNTNLCGERGSTPPRTRIAYLWASRIPNAPKPEMQIGDADYLPQGEKSSLPVTLTDVSWKYLQRARDWSLRTKDGHAYPVAVVKLQNQKALELDLSGGSIAPGDYQLGAYWDWTPFTGTGDVHIRPLSNFTQAVVDAPSQDKLLAGAGKVPITVRGDDFEFATKVEFKKLHDEFALPEPTRFLLPQGLRKGPQDSMDVLVDTNDQQPGDYQMLVYQGEDKARTINFKLLPALPKVTNLPVIANAGAGEQHFALKGERLETLERLESPGVTFSIGPVSNNGLERTLVVQLRDQAQIQAGIKLPVKAFVHDRREPLVFSDGLEITGPLPVIASSKLASLSGLAIPLRDGEYPAGLSLSATIDVKNLDPQSHLLLTCANAASSSQMLQIGQQNSAGSLQRLSPDQLYVLFDTASLPAGCHLEATIDNGRGARSKPYHLADILRVPQIDSFEALQSTPEAKTTYLLKGKNLEMIERAGWDPTNVNEIDDLPSPVPGQGQEQQLSIVMAPTQTGKDELYLWLRGDKEARATKLKPTGPAAPKS